MESTAVTDAVEAIRLRIPKEWGQWISCGEGWYRILINLDEQISYLFPEGYEIHQIKEKFGGLRYYCGYPSNDPIRARIAENLISQAERVASYTCEVCGVAKFGSYKPNLEDLTVLNTDIDDSVKLRTDGWYRTLCDSCENERGQK